MTELSDAIKDYEENATEKVLVIEDQEDLDEALEELKPPPNKQEDQLLIDMKKLVELDKMKTVQQAEGQNIQDIIDAYKKEHGFDEALKELGDNISDLRSQYSLLKTDIGKRAEENYEKTKNVDPCLGVKVTMKKNRELILDREAAVRWAVEKEHLTLLDILDDSYADLIETGVFPDQPGEVDTNPIPKARISLKPFQEEEEDE